MTSLQEPEANSPESTFLLHGVFAVRDHREGYAMVEVQQGVITGLGIGSITVTSPDGYTKSYRLDAERVEELSEAIGSRVTVMVDAEGRTMVEIGDVPIDGSDTAALIPISGQRRPFLRAPAQLASAADSATRPSDPTEPSTEASTAHRTEPSVGTSNEPPAAAR